LATAALAAVMGFSGCGGSHPPSTPTTLPPPSCTQSTLDQAADPIGALYLIYYDFSVPESGRLDVTLDWTFSSSSMGFYLVPANTCTLEEFNRRTCQFVMRSEPSALKPRKLSLATVNPGNYRWIVANFASVDESYSLAVVLSKGVCAAHVGGGAPEASATGSGGAPAKAVGITNR
jgi:hypothetical protein